VALISQHCTETFVSFDDVAVAEFFEQQVDLDRRPEQFGRIWIHTHPGHSPEPSAVDEETFARVFGSCDWAVMMILARGGASYARLHWKQGGPAQLRMNVDVSFEGEFAGSDHLAWQQQYDAMVVNESWQLERNRTERTHSRRSEEILDREYADLFGDLPPY